MQTTAGDNLRGAGLMMASMAAFTFNDTLMKAISSQMPLNQMLFLRGVLTSILILGMIRIMGGVHVRIPRRDWGLVTIRVGAEVAAAFFFLTALFNMPIANVTAILQSLPLTVTLAAALFLGEPVGWRRLSAILTGFFGVMLIVKPGAEGFTIYSIYTLIAVASVTLRDLSTRKLSRQTPSMLVTLMSSVGVTLFFGLLSLGDDWVPVAPRSGVILAGASVMIIGGYLFSIMVMRVGEISFVAPFRYTALLWALLLGWLVFGEWPDTWTLLGGAIVISSGMFMLYRERLARRQADARG
ncbi:MAG: EamA family transporter [Rhodobacterales bacterium]|nr:MAG: EamA family transporter [Rhodobacterales bacterium]